MRKLDATLKETKIVLIKGDITVEETDAIVNAANTSLRGGGGVDGAIHRAGGPTILEECIEKYPDGCKTGEAKITTGGELKTQWVVHTPGPIWRGGSEDEHTLLANSYRNSFHMAEVVGATSISYPSISTGIYAFPIQQAAPIAINTVLNCLPSNCIREVHFVLFSQRDFDIYSEALQKIIKSVEQ
ncbi:MAG: O-acetyl-ADP-ribose deacetylase [Candidatus Heimdallarchaeota archaeon]